MGAKYWLWPWVVLLPATMSLAAERADMRLLEAAARADVAAVRTLVQQGADVNVRYGDGATALHWAVHRDNGELADLLIRTGAAVNAANDLGVTPLWLAAQNGSAVMAERLLKAGADPNVRLPWGQTPLMEASRSGNVRVVQFLLDARADVNAREQQYGQTALMWAAVEGHAETVKALLASGADVHVRSSSWTANVVFAGHNLVLGQRWVDMDLPQERLGGYSPLLFAARRGDVATAAAMIAGGANVDDTAANGASALVVAAHSGHGKLAAFLLDKGADPNLDGAGYTALHAAILRRDVDLVKALVTHGADPNARLKRAHPAGRSSNDYALTIAMVGATPFWEAASFKELEIMRLLVAHGADPLFAMKNGETALAALIGRGDASQQHDSITDEGKILEAVKFVVSLGIDVNAANTQNDKPAMNRKIAQTLDPPRVTGVTPLHIAASRRFNSIIQYLVEQGANLEATNSQGQTPLAVASDETADLLRTLGAKVKKPAVD